MTSTAMAAIKNEVEPARLVQALHAFSVSLRRQVASTQGKFDEVFKVGSEARFVNGGVMKELIQKLWQAREWHDFQSVTFGDGRLVFLRIAETEVLDGNHRVLEPWFVCQVLDVHRLDVLATTYLKVLCEAEDSLAGLRAYGGESAVDGSDGFVALARSSGEIIWLVYLNTTNPFVELRFSEGAVLATSSLGATWKFPTTDPQRGFVTSTSA